MAMALLKRADTVILDTRTLSEYREKHIPGALLVPTPPPPLDCDQKVTLALRLMNVLCLVPHNTPVVIYCRKGIRAGLAQRILEEAGFQNVFLLGGVETWPLAESGLLVSSTNKP